MKKDWAILLFIIHTGACFAQEAVTLDEALLASTRYFADCLVRGSEVAALNFKAPTKELSAYIIEKLTAYIAGEESLAVMDRLELETLQRELNFQLSGDMSEEAALSIGQKLGIQAIISGSMVSLGNTYLIRIQAIDVETRVVQGAQAFTVRRDSGLAALLGVEGREAPSAAQKRQSGAKQPEQAREFSPGRRAGAAFLNLGLGLGSFSMGDWGGGAAIMAGYALAAGLIVWDLTGFSYKDDLAGVPGTIGLGVAGATLILGFTRPFVFRRNAARGQAGEGLNISLVPGPAGAGMVQMSYSCRF